MLDRLYTPIAWLLPQWHALLSTSLDPAGGAAWALAVVLLVVTVRTHQAATATLAGAPLSDSFTVAAAGTATQVVAGVLVVAMSALPFLTPRLAQRRAAPAEGPAATVQRLLPVGMPPGLLVTGLFFPVGVLLHWTTSDLWTLGQQALTGRTAVPPVPAAGAAR